MTLGLLITTCKHYYANIPSLVKNIEDCNFPKENVLIVSGQEDNTSLSRENDIIMARVNYTGLHLTGPIYLCENPHLFGHVKHWLILPDTIKLGKLFYTNVMKYYELYLKDTDVQILPFLNPVIRPTMDMGIVHTNHIHNMADYLSKIKKNMPFDVLQLKRQLIYDENTILGLPGWPEASTKFSYTTSKCTPPTIFITNHESELSETRIMIGNKVVNEVYFLNLDFYKYQRNFNGPYVNYVMEL